MTSHERIGSNSEQQWVGSFFWTNETALFYTKETERIEPYHLIGSFGCLDLIILDIKTSSNELLYN